LPLRRPQCGGNPDAHGRKQYWTNPSRAVCAVRLPARTYGLQEPAALDDSSPVTRARDAFSRLWLMDLVSVMSLFRSPSCGGVRRARGAGSRDHGAVARRSRWHTRAPRGGLAALDVPVGGSPAPRFAAFNLSGTEPSGRSVDTIIVPAAQREMTAEKEHRGLGCACNWARRSFPNQLAADCVRSMNSDSLTWRVRLRPRRWPGARCGTSCFPPIPDS
jgi:hypothetical protein